MSEKHGIEEKRIFITNRHYITLGVLIVIILWLIGATVLIMNKLQVNPLQNEKLDIKQELGKIQKKNNTLMSELSIIKEENKTLLMGFDIPILYEPSEDAAVIGDQVRFEWNYPYHNRFQKYFIEIINLSNCNKSILSNVLSPEKKRMYFPRNKLCNGRNLWRITPGYLSGDQEIIQGQHSKYGLFTVYESVVDHIQKEKIIRVGTNPTFHGKFHFIENRKIQGFDIDLIKWITSKLEKNLNIGGKLKVQIIDIPWEDLLPMLQRKELDAVISSMTSTSIREETFPGIKFTEGYFQSQQIFIQLKKNGIFPKDIKGKLVGASIDTTNEQAAIYLSMKYDFKVDSSYETYADVFQALDQKKIDFALVDDILVQNHLKSGRFHQFSGGLNKHLKEFYKENFDRDSEMYAIALFDETANELNLLSLVNSILKSKEGKNELARLKTKWID